MPRTLRQEIRNPLRVHYFPLNAQCSLGNNDCEDFVYTMISAELTTVDRYADGTFAGSCTVTRAESADHYDRLVASGCYGMSGFRGYSYRDPNDVLFPLELS
jgi:hypothetical protein